MISEKLVTILSLNNSMMYGVVALLFAIMFALIIRQVTGFPRASYFYKKTPTLARQVYTRKYSITPPNLLSQQEKDKLIAEKVWNLKGVKDEINRLYLRSIKKVGKASERLSLAKDKLASGVVDTSEVNQDILEIQEDLDQLQMRVKKLRELEEVLQGVKSTADDRFTSLVPSFIDMEISDSPPERPEKQPKKPKGKPAAPRKPYFVYESADGIEIFVGRGASDNDEVSCNPQIRHNDEWWMHVSGYAGSHVVIKCKDDDLPSKFRETVLDAAFLAATNSKASESKRVAVSLTRCRNVSKPRFAKAGLVHISGDIHTINVDMNVERRRLDRLQKLE